MATAYAGVQKGIASGSGGVRSTMGCAVPDERMDPAPGLRPGSPG
jgi:hypothetical protein